MSDRNHFEPPYHVEVEDDDTLIFDGADNLVAKAYGWGDVRPSGCAEFLVRAANNHDSLLAACCRAREVLRDVFGGGVGSVSLMEWKETLAELHEAILGAGGKFR